MSSAATKSCRKCNGPCPPCRPWRCKFGKGRSLEECANELEKTTQDRIQRVTSNVKEAIKAAGTSTAASPIKNTIQVKKSEEEIPSPELPVGRGQKCTTQAVKTPPRNNAIISHQGFSGSISPAGINQRCSIPSEPSDLGSSLIFLAIAADATLVKYSEAILNTVVAMPEVPEINSLDDYHCIWPHTVHLTIQAFGKVRNVEIPTIANYCNKNLELINPFYLSVRGMVHHEKLHALGFNVLKESVEPLRLFKSNMLRNSCMKKWINKNFSWERYDPVFSVLHSRSIRRSSQSGRPPLSKRSIEIIIRMFAGVMHMQEVYPQQDIQLCLGRSSTQSTFYKNLLE
jgi:hypothetical protein